MFASDATVKPNFSKDQVHALAPHMFMLCSLVFGFYGKVTEKSPTPLLHPKQLMDYLHPKYANELKTSFVADVIFNN